MIAAFELGGSIQASGCPYATAERGGLNPLDPIEIGRRIAHVVEQLLATIVHRTRHWGCLQQLDLLCVHAYNLFGGVSRAGW